MKINKTQKIELESQTQSQQQNILSREIFQKQKLYNQFIAQYVKNQGNFDKSISIFFQSKKPISENTVAQLRQQIKRRQNFNIFLTILKQINEKETNLFYLDAKIQLQTIQRRLSSSKNKESERIKLLLLKMSLQTGRSKQEQQTQMEILIYLHHQITKKDFKSKSKYDLSNLKQSFRKYRKSQNIKNAKEIITIQESFEKQLYDQVQIQQLNFQKKSIRVDSTSKRAKQFKDFQSGNKKSHLIEEKIDSSNKKQNTIILEESFENLSMQSAQQSFENMIIQKMSKTITQEIKKCFMQYKNYLNNKNSKQFRK